MSCFLAELFEVAPMVDVRLMQAAVALAEELNFSRAALRLAVTQPALSKQIAELEERVGMPLFERSSRGVEVTEAGAAFVEHARMALSSADRAVHSARAATLGSDTILMVGKSPNVDPFITSTMQSVRLPLFPQLQVRFSSHYSTDALKLLRSGEIDLAVVMGIKEDVGVSSIKISENPFYVVMASSDPLSVKKELQISDLMTRRLAFWDRQLNPGIYERINKALTDEQIHPAEIQHFIQPEEAAALVLQRNSLAILPKTGAWRVSDEVITIRPLRDERLVLRTFVAARLDEQSRLISEFLRVVVKRLSQPAKQTPLRLAI
jgi:DNA-binding transcriptional LysR family regulator